MSHQPEFNYDEASGICGCSIFIDDFLQGFGIAQCADQDRDMISEKTGMHIAEMRAQINLLQNYKNRELHPELKAYKHLLGTMVNSPRYNPNSYEAKRLNREIRNVEKAMREINIAIEATKAQLYNYINGKERMYQRIRANDHEGYKDEDTNTLLNDIGVYEKICGNDNKT